ncbi:MAG: hypothetical protein RLZZ580_1897 [Cyanobacteriota bacterium]|jgi:tRNA(fMet)-specific endonuclease VapC
MPPYRIIPSNEEPYFLRGNPPVIEQFRIYRQHYTYVSFSIYQSCRGMLS